LISMSKSIYHVYLHLVQISLFCFIEPYVQLFLFVYSYVHTLFEPFLPPSLLPSPPPLLFLSLPIPLLPGRTSSTLLSNFIEEKT
jgi:hypothetical protein